MRSTATGTDDRRPSAWPRRQTRCRQAVTVAVVTGLAATLAACGSRTAVGGTAAPSSSTPSTAGAAPNPEAYAQCMRAHGVPSFPEPVDGHITFNPASGIDPNSTAFRSASQACASLAPSGPGPGAPVGTSQTSNNPTTAVTAATWQSFGQWLAGQATAGQFSGAALVAQNGHVFLDAGYGPADRTTNTAGTADTKYCIASIGKLFTAVAIAQLVEDHKLSFDDTLGKYLTGFSPAVGDQVTVGELLDMTSGLGDFALSSPNPPTTLDGQIALIEKEPVQSKPGATFDYSNDSYIVLGAVIQAVSGQPYASYVEAHILQPAGMTHTALDPYTPADVTGTAHGYALTGTTLTDISDQLQIANPSGGASSTVGDLYRFAQALLDHRLLSAAMTATVLAPRVDSPQPGGPTVDRYTYGFSYQAINGVVFVGHNGGTPGYEGQIDVYPHGGYIVVILTNQDQTLVPAIRRSEGILTNA